jgi:iron(III) transport system substrate-binding protein
MQSFQFFLLSAILLGSTAQCFSKQIHVYSSRKEHLIKPLTLEYEKQTGIKVHLHIDKAGALIQKIKAEGKNSKADILLTVDAGNLWYAKQQGLFRPMSSKILQEKIPSFLKDSDNHWFGLSKRVRTIVYHSKKVRPSELSSYADLADKKWNKRLCLRTSKKVYNQSLIAMLIHELGRDKAKSIVSGWVKNSVDIYSNDTSVIKAVEAGQCDIGIVNSYYLGRLVKKDPNYPVKIFWADQKLKGSHINISGAGILKNAPNAKEAQKFIEWLTSAQAQKKFAELNLEYPVIPGIELGPILNDWGQFKGNDSFPLELAGQFQADAIKLSYEVGYK